jgi:hypothetical protein
MCSTVYLFEFCQEELAVSLLISSCCPVSLHQVHNSLLSLSFSLFFSLSNLLLYLSLFFSLTNLPVSRSLHFSLRLSRFLQNDDKFEDSMTCCSTRSVSAAATRTSPLDPDPKSTWQIVGNMFLQGSEGGREGRRVEFHARSGSGSNSIED